MVLHNYGGISNNEGGVGEEGGSARDTVGGDGCDDRDGEWRHLKKNFV